MKKKSQQQLNVQHRLKIKIKNRIHKSKGKDMKIKNHVVN
jgi:hypothetical protein